VSKSKSVAPEGQPTHGVKIRVHGVEGVAAERVLSKLQGTIGQFLRKNQTQVKLGEHAQYASRMAVPGGSIRYKNNNGLETVDVEVEGQEELEEKAEAGDAYWQWAIVEITIPDMTLTSAEMSAFMNPKPKAPLQGVAWDDNENYDAQVEGGAPLAYPDVFGDANGDWVQLQTLTGQTDQVSSLRVDLRPYPGGVKFDLYGYIHSYTDPDKHGPATNSFLRAGQRANSVTSQSGTWHTPNGTSGVYANGADCSSRVIGPVMRVAIQSIIEDQFPETIGQTFSAVSQGTLNSFFQQQGPALTIGGPGIAYGPAYAGQGVLWSPGSGNMPTDYDVSGIIAGGGGSFVDTATYWDVGGTIIAKHRGLGVVTAYTNASTGFQDIVQAGGPVDAQGGWSYSCYDYTSYFLASFSPLTVYPTRAGPVRFAVFDGEGPDAYTRLQGISGGFGTRNRWESSKRGVGKRWPMKQIAVANIRSIDEPGTQTIANHFGMVKIGTVIINPRKGKGGIKFIAA
jgi:hypothetical protein